MERALAPFTRMNYRFTLNISNDLANNTFERREADLEGWVNGAEPDSNYLIEGRLFCCVAEKFFLRVEDYVDKAPK